MVKFPYPAKSLVIWTCLFVASIPVFGQEISGISLRVTFEETTLSQALVQLTEVTGVNIVFSPDMIPERDINGIYQGNLNIVLADLLTGSGMTFREQDGQLILFRDPDYYTPFRISGYIEELETGEHLIAANVYDIISGNGTYTNEYGFFTMHGRGGKALLVVSYLGFRQDTIEVLKESGSIAQRVQLERHLVLREVVIEGENQRKLHVEPLGAYRFTDRQLESKSYFGGEVDVQRYMESLPGISTGTDGIGGMHVRGGNGDQNLVLFDGVPIYHSTHAIGILSVFNPLMVREVNVLKGNFASKYAGRLSSVLDVRTKEGSNRQWSFRSSIGSVSANVLAEGPLVCDKVGILVAARRFVPGFYLRHLSRNEKERSGLTGHTDYGFNDFNAKCNISLSPKDRMFLSYYHGDDLYDDITTSITVIPESTTKEVFTRELRWGNSTGVLRWNHQVGAHIFINTTVTLSSFELRTLDYLDFEEVLASQLEVKGYSRRQFGSKIRDAGGRFDVDQFINNTQRVKYGLMYTRHQITPRSIAFDDAAQIGGFPIDEDNLDDQLDTLLKTTSSEFGVYVEHIADISNHVSLSAGVHISGFDSDNTLYLSAQPRVMLRIQVHEKFGLHLSASKMTQYLHLLTSSGIGLPTDLWVPSTESVKPQHAYQGAIGLEGRVTQRLTLQTELYYRKMENMTAYQEGASFLVPEGSLQTGILDAANWENKVTQGTGTTYGWENTFNWQDKAWNASVSYTYAHATRKFEELNFGRSFDFRFDRRHAFTLSSAFHVNDNLQVSMGWNFATGIPITLAESKFQHPSSSPVFPPVEVLEFSDYNTFRLPDYHRLDMGVKYSWTKPRAVHSLHIDLYNVYNRKNVLYMTLIQDGEEFRNQRFTVLPFVPSLSYHLKI